MIDQKLIYFVKEKLKQGLSKETISQQLASANWTVQDIKEGFSAVENGEVSNISTRIILFIQIIIIIFMIILILSSLSCGGGSGYCGYGQILLFLPSMLLFLIFTIIGNIIYSKKAKKYKLNNTDVPILVKLLHIIPRIVLYSFLLLFIIRMLFIFRMF